MDTALLVGVQVHLQTGILNLETKPSLIVHQLP